MPLKTLTPASRTPRTRPAVVSTTTSITGSLRARYSPGRAWRCVPGIHAAAPMRHRGHLLRSYHIAVRPTRLKHRRQQRTRRGCLPGTRPGGYDVDHLDQIRLLGQEVVAE